jgi:ubiquinone/menaquinone biosynthesis C-methylase UbiE
MTIEAGFAGSLAGKSAPPDWFSANAEEAAARYEATSPEAIHNWMADFMPSPGSLAIDLGAGSGRDAEWLARHGLRVIAAEPNPVMRAGAERAHHHPSVHWMGDSLPELKNLRLAGVAADLVMATAVWMFIAPGQRPAAMASIASILHPSGIFCAALRLGPADAARGMVAVCTETFKRNAADHGLDCIREAAAADLWGRPEITWAYLAFRKNPAWTSEPGCRRDFARIG